MIISGGRNYIFVHIPKTGGTSMALALEARAMKDDILIGDTPKAIRRRARLDGADAAGKLWKHSMLADIDGLVQLDQIQAAFCFTMVRNPWDRMVSYYHWLREQCFRHPAVELSKSSDFSGFVNALQTRISFAQAPYQRYMTASDGAEYCRLYIRLENLEEDTGPLWDHLGFRLDLPVVNRSNRDGDYRSYYSDADADLVSKFCARDIERFGYAFS